MSAHKYKLNEETIMEHEKSAVDLHTMDSTATMSPTRSANDPIIHNTSDSLSVALETEGIISSKLQEKLLQEKDGLQLYTSSSPEEPIEEEQLTEKRFLPSPTEDPPSISSRQENGEVDVEHVSTNTIVCRAWETNFVVGDPQKNSEKESSQHIPEAISEIPERDIVLWQIKDLSDFRRAFQVTRLPPLVSPEFGQGCHILLCLCDKKKHISGTIELPLLKATKEGVVHIKLTVVRPDMKGIVTRNVEIQVRATETRKAPSSFRPVSKFILSKSRAFCEPKYQHLVYDNQLRIRIELQYFPFDSRVFCRTALHHSLFPTCRTSENNSRSENQSSNFDSSNQSELLYDIRAYCQEEPSQNVEIRRDDVVFHSCRFLLSARSKKFREIFSTHNSISTKKEWSIRAFSTSSHHFKAQPLSCITIRDISTDVLDQLLKFIHTDTCPWVDEQNKDVLNVLELFEAADLYGVTALSSRLIKNLSQRMNIDNFVYMFEVSERCKNELFKQICNHFMDSLPGSQVATLMRATCRGYNVAHSTSTSVS